MMRKKGLFTLVAIMTVLIAVILTGCGKAVDISDAAHVYFDGVDGDGVAYAYVDASMVEDLISDTWKNGSDMDWGTLFSLSESLSITLDKDEKLSNGDKVKATIEFSEEDANKLNVKLKGVTTEVAVEGLMERKTVDAFDPKYFNVDGDTGINLNIQGYDEYATMYIRNNCDNSNPLCYVDYHAEKADGLSNGDKVKIIAEMTYYGTSQGYVLKANEYEFEVKGLEEVKKLPLLSIWEDRIKVTGPNGAGEARLASYPSNTQYDASKKKLTFKDDNLRVVAEIEDVEVDTNDNYYKILYRDDEIIVKWEPRYDSVVIIKDNKEVAYIDYSIRREKANGDGDTYYLSNGDKVFVGISDYSLSDLLELGYAAEVPEIEYTVSGLGELIKTSDGITDDVKKSIEEWAIAHDSVSSGGWFSSSDNRTRWKHQATGIYYAKAKPTTITDEPEFVLVTFDGSYEDLDKPISNHWYTEKGAWKIYDLYVSNGSLGCITDTTYEFKGSGSYVNSSYDSIDKLVEDLKKEYDVVKIDFTPTITAEAIPADDPKPDDSQSGSNFKVRVNHNDGVNFRSGPGVDNSKVISGVIPKGQELVITKVEKDSSGDEWGYTIFDGKEGWVILRSTEKID